VVARVFGVVGAVVAVADSATAGLLVVVVVDGVTFVIFDVIAA